MVIFGSGAESRPAWTRMVRFRSFAFHAFQQDSNYSNHDSEPSSECRQCRHFRGNVDRKIQGTPSSASKDTPREKNWELVGGWL